MSVRLGLIAVLALLAISTTVSAAEPAPKADPADAIAALIDKHLSADWAARGIKPAAQTDDAEFVRRVYLDLIGRAPRAPESREFLDDETPNKRSLLVEKLLTLPVHAGHFAAVTRAAWLPQTQSNVELAEAGVEFENWLRMRYRDNTPADEVVRKILTAQLKVNRTTTLEFRLVESNGAELVVRRRVCMCRTPAYRARVAE